MTTRHESSKSRTARPVAEELEGRRLLSSVVTGRDIDGDTFAIRLIGPGQLRVVKQDGADGNPAPLDSATLIRDITIAGTDPRSSRVVGTVTRGAGGDGRVFFANLEKLSSPSQEIAGGNGLVGIDLPQFFLGDTDPTTVSAAGTPKATISLPDGVNTLRIGGADTTAFFGTVNAQRLNQNGVADNFLIDLGLPSYGGTRIIVDRVTTNAQAGVTTGTTTANPTQDGVTFNVAGRLNLFQANTIEGNGTFASGRFQGEGGTLVQSVPTTTGITGQIGDVRVGGNATNFAVQTNSQVANYSVGGETNNVYLLAPDAARNVVFGKGMDTATIQAGQIETLSANRGALNSRVVVDRTIGRAKFGGDVVNSQILAGYNQGLATIFQQQQDNPTTTAVPSGAIEISVAGDVVDSVIAASVQPLNEVFGTPGDLFLPHGSINAKVEGTIDNQVATPDSPLTAFYANDVVLNTGPVTPPDVPEAPYPKPTQPTNLPGIRGSLDRRPVVRPNFSGPRGPLMRQARLRERENNPI